MIGVGLPFRNTRYSRDGKRVLFASNCYWGVGSLLVQEFRSGLHRRREDRERTSAHAEVQIRLPVHTEAQVRPKKRRSVFLAA